MADAWVYRDGQRLTPAMLYDFLALDAEFYARTGCRLKISSGVRSDDEQERIWYDRMVLADQVRGRKVYETRWWNGRLWYRISSAGTVAPPGSSNHQINVAAGRRGALDLYDTGADAGILTRGSFRARVFDEIAPKHGYDSEGYGFGETWHKRYGRDGRNPWRAVPTSGGATTPTTPAPTAPNEREDDMPRNTGIAYDRKNPANGKITTTYNIHNTGSGFEFEISNGEGGGPLPGSYVNPIAQAYDTPSWAKVTEGQAMVTKAALAALRPASAQKVEVTIVNPDE